MFTAFISQNLLWVGAFVVVANLLLLSVLQGNVKGVGAISALQLPTLQRGGKSVIIDVNDENHFKLAHIPDSVNYPMGSINASNAKLNKLKNKTTILVCQTGTKANKAAKLLVGLGFSDLHVLRGGLTNWTKENLPISTG
jgi:rhodanese-related sulfurtransferase